jgi:hypothetical protein
MVPVSVTIIQGAALAAGPPINSHAAAMSVVVNVNRFTVLSRQ